MKSCKKSQKKKNHNIQEFVFVLYNANAFLEGKDGIHFLKLLPINKAFSV